MRRTNGAPLLIDLTAAAALMMAGTPGSASPIAPMQVAQVTIREQIIVRVPMRMRQVAPAAPSLLEWKEGKGPKCVPARSIIGASLLSPDSVDLILRNNSRVRARLSSSCPALDYYYGFYVRPSADGMICADRDTIRSRVGGQCEIRGFRSLWPKRHD